MPALRDLRRDEKEVRGIFIEAIKSAMRDLCDGIVLCHN